mmetsp:Transcript_2680/g.5751  ORF Transcript_2680/g.5751 Transcript_2680/m.5751 type:complete len:213 (+) Transcript_2680:1625-2263(+)
MARKNKRLRCIHDADVIAHIEHEKRSNQHGKNKRGRNRDGIRLELIEQQQTHPTQSLLPLLGFQMLPRRGSEIVIRFQGIQRGGIRRIRNGHVVLFLLQTRNGQKGQLLVQFMPSHFERRLLENGPVGGLSPRLGTLVGAEPSVGCSAGAADAIAAPAAAAQGVERSPRGGGDPGAGHGGGVVDLGGEGAFVPGGEFLGDVADGFAGGAHAG